MTIPEIIAEFQNLAPEYGKWRIDRNLARAWLTSTLTRYREELIEEMMPEEDTRKLIDCERDDGFIDGWNACIAEMRRRAEKLI